MSSLFEQIPELRCVPGLHHVISTRHGGVSEGVFSSLNLGYHVGDDPERVTENRRRLAAAAGYDADALVTARQVHGAQVTWVDRVRRGSGAFSWESALPDTDGLIIAESGIPIAIQVADCAPVLIVDPQRRVLALVHAGWRGALARIASAAVAQMVARTGSHVRELLVGIGPSLCPTCLEVGEEVGAAVEHELGPDVLVTGLTKPHLNLPAMLAADLAGAGVDARHIITHPACTRCHNARFFSHRGQAGHAGRIAMVAWWERE